MVKIRLTRFGKHKSPAYRIVAVDSKAQRDGACIEQIGTFNPTTKEGVKIDREKALNQLRLGAQPTETVKNFFKKIGI
jgi:small subunit ribosomal protein S16